MDSTNCAACNSSGQCTACSSSFYLSSGECRPCSDQLCECIACRSVTGRCTPPALAPLPAGVGAALAAVAWVDMISPLGRVELKRWAQYTAGCSCHAPEQQGPARASVWHQLQVVNPSAFPPPPVLGDACPGNKCVRCRARSRASEVSTKAPHSHYRPYGAVYMDGKGVCRLVRAGPYVLHGETLASSGLSCTCACRAC